MASGTGIAGGAAAGAQAGSAFGPWGTVIGGVLGGVAGAIGGKKKAPATVPYIAPDPQQQQKLAIRGNLGASDDIEALLGRSNDFLQTQANEMMEKAVPGWGAFSKRLLEEGQSSLDNRYNLPTEVQDNLTRLASERGISRGTRGQTNQYSLLRDFGVNMLDYGDRQFQNALNALQTVTGVSPRVSPISPMSFFITPQTQLQSATTTALAQQGIAQGGANAAAAVSNFNTQNLWDNLAASLTYIGAGIGEMNGAKAPTTTAVK